MRIYSHLCFYHNGNIGDRFLVEGIRNLLRQYGLVEERLLLPVEIFSWDSEKDVKMLNSSSFLIVGGGGMLLWYFGQFWRFLDKIQIPFVVYGVGLNDFRVYPGGRKAEIPPERLEQIKKIKEKSFHFSVRNDGSKEILKEYGIVVEETIDPGFFAGMNKIFPSPSKKKYVIFNIAGDFINDRFNNNGITVERFLEIAEETSKILIKKGYKVCFTSHLPEDEYYCKILENKLPKEYILSWSWKNLVDSVDTALAYYSNAEFVIAMRGHAQIVSLGMNVPVIAIGTQNKNIEIMRRLGLEKYYVEIGNPKLEKILIEKINLIEKERTELIKLINLIIINFRERVKAELTLLKERLETNQTK